MFHSIMLDWMFTMLMADLLSLYNLVGEQTMIQKSCINLSSHITSHILCAIAWNSASALLIATTVCFLLLHVTKLPYNLVQYPEVDLQSSLPAQFASTYPSILMLSVLETLVLFLEFLWDTSKYDLQPLDVSSRWMHVLAHHTHNICNIRPFER